LKYKKQSEGGSNRHIELKENFLYQMSESKDGGALIEAPESKVVQFEVSQNLNGDNSLVNVGGLTR